MLSSISRQRIASVSRALCYYSAVICTALALSPLPSLSYAEPVNANENSPARLNAQRYLPMDSGQPIHIMLYEDSDQALALAAGLKTALEKAGYLVTSDGAPLTLSFEITGQGESSGSSQQSILSLESNSSSSIQQRYQAHLDVYSTTQESLTTGNGRPSAAQTSSGPRMRYQIYLNDSATGKRLWEGWATSPLLAQGAEATALAMTDPLIAALGETVRDRGIGLHAK